MKSPLLLLLGFLLCSLVQAVAIDLLDTMNTAISKRGVFWDFIGFCVLGKLGDCPNYPQEYIETTTIPQPTESSTTSEIMKPEMVAKLIRKKMKWIEKELKSLKSSLGNRQAFSKLSEEAQRKEIFRATIIWNACARKFARICQDDWESFWQHTEPKNLKKLEKYQEDILEIFTHVKSYILDFPRVYGIQSVNLCDGHECSY